VPVAPAASRALCIGRTHTSNNEYTGIARHSRTQWSYGLFRALLGDRALLPPSPANQRCIRAREGRHNIRVLDASVGASGPHDFAVRNNISRPRAVDRSQASSTCPAIPSHARRCRVHRNPPRVRDDGQHPSCGVGWRELVEMICPTGEVYFCKQDWTPLSTNHPTGKSLEPLLFASAIAACQCYRCDVSLIFPVPLDLKAFC
jgi:hypothetical protein